MHRWLTILLLLAIAADGAVSACAADEPANAQLRLLPVQVRLAGPEARQRLLLLRTAGDLNLGDAGADANYASSDPNVVRCEGGVLIPTGNGRATVTATANGQSASCDVMVEAFDAAWVWSFRNHVESVLSKSGCNSGACHGAFAGKRGFKLSLRGFDAEADYSFITRQARARRVNREDPGRSLILTKPTGAIPHKGGLRFATDSPEYRVIADWIAAGAPAPTPADPRIQRLEVLPECSRLAPASRQPLVVRAHFSDGHEEDVTRWAKFSSTNDAVATIDTSGLVQVTGSGEAALSAWYLSQNVVATVSVPYPGETSPETFRGTPRRNFIDDLSLAKLESLNLPPSPPCGDGEFIRRVFLDTLGVLPTASETRAFLTDPAPDKRDRLIDAVLERPEFVDYWTTRWCDLLLASGERLRPQALESYYRWIRRQVKQNTPWDQFVYQLVTAEGTTFENGAANFYALHESPTDIAETVAAAFLGMTINCARCHNHPLEKWTNDQYFAMANLFSRVQSKGWGGDFRAGDGDRTVYSASEGELLQPSKGRPQPPCPLDGEPLNFESRADRRVPLARWLIAPGNPYFTRAITNRVWANFFAVGLVEKVDDLRLTNPASDERLLAAAAQYLADEHYDLKALMRAILQSATYQRSSQTLEANRTDERFYSHYYPRRLSAEVLLDALSQVTAVPTQFRIRYGESDLKDLPLGPRALEMIDVDASSYFFKSFGRPARQITCDCERANQPTMVQVLHLSNGDTLNQKLTTAGNRIDRQLALGTPRLTMIEDLYLSALSRRPTDDETRQLLDAMTSAAETDPHVLVEDLYWGVLSSREFLFNH